MTPAGPPGLVRDWLARSAVWTLGLSLAAATTVGPLGFWDESTWGSVMS